MLGRTGPGRFASCLVGSMPARSLLCAALTIGCFVCPSAVMAQRPGGGRASSAPAVRVSGLDPWGRSAGAPGAGLGSLPDYVGERRAEQGPKVNFKAETVLVEVPAVVTDKAGRPVHHLTQADFQVLENGSPQKIALFDEINTQTTRLAAPAQPGEFSNALAGGNIPQAVTVIALDTVNTPYLDQKYGREQLLKYLAQHLDSTQPVALVMITSRGLQVIQDFTQPPARLLAVLKEATGEMPFTQADNLVAMAKTMDLGQPASSGLIRSFVESGDAQIASFHQGDAVATTLEAFLDLAWALSGVQGHKSVIWLTAGFPFQMTTPSMVPSGDLYILYERTFQQLSQANMSIYPVDARGLVDPIADVSSGAKLNASTNARIWLHNSSLDTLSEVAAMTGGQAFFNGNDLAAALGRAMRDSASYYLLGYYLDPGDRSPGWRKLKIELGEKDMKAHARTGFFLTQATINPAVTRNVDLSYALSSPFDATGLPLQVRVLGESGKGKDKEIEFHVRIPANGIAVQGADHHFDMDFIARATAKESQRQETLAQNIRGRIADQQIAKVESEGLGFKKTIQLAPGQYQLRFVVRDDLTGRIGTVSTPLTVN